jgi:hypothetical protein
LESAQNRIESVPIQNKQESSKDAGIEQIVQSYSTKIRGREGFSHYVFFKPNIPHSITNEVVAQDSLDRKGENILLVIDDSFEERKGRGLLLTTNTLLIRTIVDQDIRSKEVNLENFLEIVIINSGLRRCKVNGFEFTLEGLEKESVP